MNSYCAFIQDILEDSGWLNTHLDNVESLTDNLQAGTGLASKQKSELEQLQKRHKTLQAELTELISGMETGAQIVDQFQVKKIVCLVIINMYVDYSLCNRELSE